MCELDTCEEDICVDSYVPQMIRGSKTIDNKASMVITYLNRDEKVAKSYTKSPVLPVDSQASLVPLRSRDAFPTLL